MSTQKILVRAGKSPFEPASPLQTLTRNLTLTNVGNLLFQHAFIRHIYTPTTQIFTVNDTVLTDDIIGQINESFDAVYLPFANAFRPTFKGGLRNWCQMLDKLKIPVVIVGVGAQCESDNPIEELREINSDVKALCERVLDKSRSIGVRGNFTANYLNDLGIKNVDVIGCPSMFYFGSSLPIPKQLNPDEVQRIALHFSPQSPANLGAINHNVASELQAFVEFVKAHPSVSVEYIAQDSVELKNHIWGVQGITLKELSPDLGDIPTRHPIDTHVWINDLKRYDLAIGTRIHGTIAGVLAGIPSMIMCHDSRTRELAQWFDIPRFDYSKNHDALTPGLLAQKANSSTMAQVFPQRYQAYLEFLRKNNVSNVEGYIGDNNPHLAAYESTLSALDFPSTPQRGVVDVQLLNEKINQLYQVMHKR